MTGAGCRDTDDGGRGIDAGGGGGDKDDGGRGIDAGGGGGASAPRLN